MKNIFRCLLLVATLLLLTQPAMATTILEQLQHMQQQIQTLRNDVKQKQEQIDLIQHQLSSILKKQHLQPTDAVKPTPSASLATPVNKKSTDATRITSHSTPIVKPALVKAAPSPQAVDDEVLFSNGLVFASDEQAESWPGWLNTFNINGNIALRYEAGSNQQRNQGFTDTFRLSDFNLDFSFEPTPRLDVGLGLQMQELKIKNPVRQGLKIDSTSQIKHQFIAKYAFANYAFKKWFQLRFGDFLTPFGVYNESLYSDYDSKLVERPFLNVEIIPVIWTQLGIQLHGDITLTPAWQIHYAIYTGNGMEALQDKNGIIKSSRIRDMTHQLVSRFNSNRAIGGRLGLFGNAGQHHVEIGISSYHGAWNPLATLNLNMLGSDFWYHYKGLDLRAEWALAAQDIALGTQYNYGWYVQAAYRWRLFEPVFRFGRLRNRFVDQNGPFIDDRHRQSVGLNVYLGKFFTLKTSYSGTTFSATGRHEHRVTSTLTAGF